MNGIKGFNGFNINDLIEKDKERQIYQEKYDHIMTSLASGNSQKHMIQLSEEQIEKLPHIEGMTLYYFPGDCPSYKEEVYIKTGKDGMERYYVPEKNSIILVDDSHSWTKDPSDFDIIKK